MIVEIWRETKIVGIPTRFAVGEQPQFINGEGNLEAIQESPPVKLINFYVGGAFGNKAYRDECYVVQFVDSPMRRIVPMTEVKDILWEVPVAKKAEVIAIPELEA